MKEEELLNNIRDHFDQLEHYPYQPSKEDWEELKNRLQEDKKKKRRGFVIFITAAASIVLVASFGFLLLQQSNSNRYSKNNKNQELENTEEVDLTDNQRIDQPEGSQSPNMIDQVPISSLPYESNESEIELSPSRGRDNRLNDQRNINSGTSTVVRDNSNGISVEKTGTPSIAKAVNNKNQQQSDSENQPNLNKIHVNQLAILEQTYFLDGVVNFEEVNLITNQTETVRKGQQPNEKKLSFSLALKPQTSAHSINEFGDFGGAVGGSLNYNITPNLSSHASLFYARQNYHVTGTDYNGVDQYWINYTNSFLPENVNAFNQVIEFPLGFNYKFLELPNFSLISAGIGMQNQIKLFERHNFDFGEDVYGPDMRSYWQLEEDDLQIANGLTLSGSYDTQLTNGIRLSLSPYIDFPLQENAWGQLSINNKGIKIAITPQKR